MKTLELKLKKDVLIVDTIDFILTEEMINNKVDNIILADYEFLCKGSELTEEIASELVDKSIYTGLYAHYVDKIPVNTYCYNSAIESFISAVESKGFYWLKHNVRSFSLYDPRSKTGWHDLEEEDTITKQWQEAEEKTFRNPLILVKKS